MAKPVILSVNKREIGILRVGEVDYISLTDIAKLKNADDPSTVIKNWMRNKDSFDFYCLWEELFNPDFNSVESHRIRTDEVGYNAFTISPAQWKSRTNAIGIMPSAGKYSIGTFAHPDIAMEFASWIDATFKLYLIKEFQRLKTEESKLLAWSAKRELAKINYHIQTDAIKENLIVPTLTEAQKGMTYASEAELLNVALFGTTSKEWRQKHIAEAKSGENIRDYATVHQLLVLANMESFNSIMIKDGLPSDKRLERLNETARQQLQVLLQVDNRLLLPKPDKK